MKQVKKIPYDGYTYIEGGVCAAKGFLANGLYCGIKENLTRKPDLCLVVSEKICHAAAVFTQNKLQAAPVTVSKRHLSVTGGVARAMILNSKNANACNADGIEKSEAMCKMVADHLDISVENILVAQTGVIGEILPIDPIASHMDELCAGLSKNGNDKAAIAIMTTDTVPKEVAVEFELDGRKCHVGGMGKGSGMIAPNMATTLNVITTDCAIAQDMLQRALDEIVKITYNCLYIDGDQSTNDTCAVLANGMAQNQPIVSPGEDYDRFRKALYIVMEYITKMMAKDGEGATKLLECRVTGGRTQQDAITVAKSVISSNLFKCAMFGEDANWGRILCAIGYSAADFDITRVNVTLSSKFGTETVCQNGASVSFSEENAAKILASDEIVIQVTLGDGTASATAWGCDLTYDYVKINGDYRT